MTRTLFRTFLFIFGWICIRWFAWIGLTSVGRSLLRGVAWRGCGPRLHGCSSRTGTPRRSGKPGWVREDGIPVLADVLLDELRGGLEGFRVGLLSIGPLGQGVREVREFLPAQLGLLQDDLGAVLRLIGCYPQILSIRFHDKI